jgi:hypothetical protein
MVGVVNALKSIQVGVEDVQGLYNILHFAFSF